jgi:hypothetical protein
VGPRIALKGLRARFTGPSRPPGPPNLCYIHIYKCGGSSLRKHITDHLVTPRTLLVDQWAYDWEWAVTARDRGLGNLARAEYLRYLSRDWRDGRHVVVLTHAFFYAFMTRWPGFSFATLLRDPVRRVLSQFHYQKRTFERCRDDELTAWLDGVSAFEFNMQTAALCGAPATTLTETHLEMAKANLHHFDFVGFVDDYADALDLFDRVYGVVGRTGVPRLNASPDPVEVSAEVAESLRERCDLDCRLVEYARRLYLAKRAALDMIDTGDPEVLPPTMARLAEAMGRGEAGGGVVPSAAARGETRPA